MVRLLVLFSPAAKIKLKKAKNASCNNSIEKRLHRISIRLKISEKCFFSFMIWKMMFTGRNTRLGYFFSIKIILNKYNTNNNLYNTAKNILTS